jgi:SAM-dependent methyltransferase
VRVVASGPAVVALERIDCPLCEIDDAIPYAEENGYLAVRCRGCGLVYLRERPTIESMKALYQGQETQIDLRSHMRDRDWRTALAKRMLAMLQRHRRGGRLLEIGSAAGWFLAQAREAGFDVQGLDLTHQLCEFAQGVLGIPTFEGTLRQAPFAKGSFGVVFMRNVLSHLSDPIGEHEIIHDLLEPGGLLMFETGNVAEIDAERAGFLELPDHLFHWGESTIRTLLERSGFRTLECQRFVVLHEHPVVVAAREAVQSIRPKKAKRAKEVPTALTEMPASTLRGRVVGELRQRIRYDLGARMPATGQRCTLVVTAQRE